MRFIRPPSLIVNRNKDIAYLTIGQGGVTQCDMVAYHYGNLFRPDFQEIAD